MEEKQLTRIEYVDGMRGISSLFVVFCHLACVFLPGLYFDNKAGSLFEKLWLDSPLNVLTNGGTAVSCFFVLSGFLIARKMYLKKQTPKAISPFRQYCKLLSIVLPAVLLAALLMKTNLMFHLKAFEQNSTLAFVKGYNNFTPTIKSVLLDSFYSPFVQGSSYIGPFWTIQFEFLGSILISAVTYLIAAIPESGKVAKYVYLCLAFVFLVISPNFSSFFLGAFAFDFVYRCDTDNSVVEKALNWFFRKKWRFLLLFAVGFYFSCTNNSLTGLWRPIGYLPDIIKGNNGFLRACGASLILICIEKSALLKKTLSLQPFKWLGKISAYTYAFHWPILLSLGCGLYLLLANKLSYGWIVLIVSLAVLVVSCLLAWIFTIIMPHIKNCFVCLFGKIELLFKPKKEV